MEFKGTKGEWKCEFNHKPKKTSLEVNVYPYKKRPYYKINIYSYILGEDDCSVKGCGCIGEEEANAKLIAAAPELLNALSEILRWSAHFPQSMNEELQAGIKAIKKATE